MCAKNEQSNEKFYQLEILPIAPLKHLPAELLHEMCGRRAVCGHIPGTAYDEFRSALCSVDSKSLSQTALRSRRVLE